MLAESILVGEQQSYYLTIAGVISWIHTFSKGISPKVNAITRLEIELVYFNTAVQRFRLYTMVTRYSCITCCWTRPMT